jgi:hypothetical protein
MNKKSFILPEDTEVIILMENPTQPGSLQHETSNICIQLQGRVVRSAQVDWKFPEAVEFPISIYIAVVF